MRGLSPSPPTIGCKPRTSLLAVLVVALFAVAPACFAGALAEALFVQSGGLWALDLTTGVFSLVTPLSESVYPAGITLSASGELLALSGNRLVAIDTVTGEVTERATFHLGVEQEIFGMAEDACGRIFLRALNFDPLETRIIRLDPATGTAETALVLPAEAAAGLAIRGQRMYILGSVDGELGFLGIHLDNGSVVEHPVGGFPVFFGGYDFDAEGQIWMAAGIPPILPPPPPPVQRFDLDTGEVTEHPGVYVPRFAISPPGGQCLLGAPQVIPTLSPWALVVLAISLAIAAAWVRRGSRA